MANTGSRHSDNGINVLNGHLDGGPVALALARRQEGCIPADVVRRVEGVLIARVAAQHRTRRSDSCTNGAAVTQMYSAKISCKWAAEWRSDTVMIRT